jgi:arginase family enzyme
MNSSITPGHCELAPAAIRKSLARYSLYDPDGEVDLELLTAKDCGDFDFNNESPEAAFDRAVKFIAQTTEDSMCTVLLGGDNGVTRPGMHAMELDLRDCGLLTFDAHHDLRALEGGLTDGNPIRALLADGLPGQNVIQIGIQAFANSRAYAQVARDEGITVVTADEVYAQGIDAVVNGALKNLASKRKAIYVDFDVDVLDRTFAPACPGSRPGGLQPWMLRRAAHLCGRHGSVWMMDIVEVDPTKDIADVTCLAAASLLLAFASGVASQSGH